MRSARKSPRETVFIGIEPLKVGATTFDRMYVKVYGYDGTFVKGDPKILALCFWSAFQGIMEELTISKKLDTPDPEWLMAILRK